MIYFEGKINPANWILLDFLWTSNFKGESCKNGVWNPSFSWFDDNTKASLLIFCVCFAVKYLMTFKFYKEIHLSYLMDYLEVE